MESKIYSGITVKQFVGKLDQEEEENLFIKVNNQKYNPLIHDYKLIKSFRVRQEMVRKEFKEKIIVQLNDIDDVLRIAPDTREFKSTFGYVVKIIIQIKTD